MVSAARDVGSLGEEVLAKFREFDVACVGTIEPWRLKWVLEQLDDNFFTEARVDALLCSVRKEANGMVRYEDLLRFIGVLEPTKEKQKASDFVDVAAFYKQSARTAMLRDGVHAKFLDDTHWSRMWSKHFERSVNFDPSRPFDQPIPETFPGCNLRVLQWNLLAEGLVPEGFMMPLVSKAHVERLDNYLAALLDRGNLEDLAEVAKCSADGCRGMVWREACDGETQGCWEDFAKMACNMVVAMKGLKSKEKEARGIDLKKRYNPDIDGIPGQLTINEKAIVGTEHRLLRVLWFVAMMQPDIITFQELDNFHYIKTELRELGYSCGSDNASPYVPLKDREAATYIEKLRSSKYAFAPKTHIKKKKSTARFFLEKRIEKGTDQKAKFMEKDVWPIDDDGQAIFWRSDRFQLVGDPEFEALPGDADIDAFISGRLDDIQCCHCDQAAVRVLLEFKGLDDKLRGQRVYVSTTHLSSGSDAEVSRIHQLRHLGRFWGCTDLPQIWAMDANTEVDYDDRDGSQGCAVNIPMEANALRSFMRDNELRSVWEEHYKRTNPISQPPVSVWKMRGSASAQPKKVGEDMYQLIDHILFNGHGLLKPGQQALRLREKKGCNPADRDWLALMPNELLPSDHLPIVWDFQLNVEAPRWEASVLIPVAQAFWQKFLAAIEPLKPDDWLVSLFYPCTSGVSEQFSKDVLPTWLQEWLRRIVKEAKSVLHTDLGEATSILEDFRNQIIIAKGSNSEEAITMTIIEGLLLTSASMASTDEDLISRHGVSTNDRNNLALGAMRCLARVLPFDSLSSMNAICGWNLHPSQFWSMFAQLTEIVTKESPRIVDVFDRQGQVSIPEVDQILAEINDAITTKRKTNAPALLAIRCIDWRRCATGSQVATAASIILRAIEAGNLLFPNNTDGECLGFSSPVFQLRASVSTRLTPFGFARKQTFDQSSAISAMAVLAASGNLDSGGGLALLFDHLKSHLEEVLRVTDECDLPERQARALNRPPPLVVVNFTRRLVVSACESLEPIDVLMVPTQKLDVHADHLGKSSMNFVSELVKACCRVPSAFDLREQISTCGRILRLLSQLSEKVGAIALLAPTVHAEGSRKFKLLLESLQSLKEDDVIRWKTHKQLINMLDILLMAEVKDNPVASALQARMRAAVEEPEFLTLFMKRPTKDTIASKGFDFKEVCEDIDKFDLVQKLQSKM